MYETYFFVQHSGLQPCHNPPTPRRFLRLVHSERADLSHVRGVGVAQEGVGGSGAVPNVFVQNRFLRCKLKT